MNVLNNNNLTIRRAELQAQLNTHSARIRELRDRFIKDNVAVDAGKPKGFKRYVNKRNIFSSATMFFDGAWLAWKLYKKLKK
ncbi:MAG: hypothetical protein HUK08_03230 [Bacteroidaceae bacterium]|nr:hypothetical protein [Bacteroidaceae bacterium]